MAELQLQLGYFIWLKAIELYFPVHGAIYHVHARCSVDV